MPQSEGVTSQAHIFALIQQLTGQGYILAVPRLYIYMMGGDMTAAVFLSQLLYWSDKGTRGDGYIYKSRREWEKETGIGASAQRRIRDKLEGMGLITTKLHRANGAPTLHYRIEKDVLLEQMGQFVASDKWTCRQQQMDLSPAANGFVASDKTLTKITTKTTTEITAKTTQESDNANSGGVQSPTGPSAGAIRGEATKPKSVSVGSGDAQIDKVAAVADTSKVQAKEMVARAMYHALWPTLDYPEGKTKRAREARRSAEIAADRVLERIGRENYREALDACHLLMTDPTEDEDRWLGKASSVYAIVDTVTGKVDELRRGQRSTAAGVAWNELVLATQEDREALLEEAPGPTTDAAPEWWRQAQGVLAGSLAPGTYSAYLGPPARPVGDDNGVITIATHARALDWANSQLAGRVSKVISSVRGAAVTVRFVTLEGTTE